jgi:hypothetical protein
MRKNFENIKIKYSVLSKTKKELEDVIFMQENKVKELSSNVKKVSNIIKLKDKEIKDNKLYITNLEDTIKQLSSEFKILRKKKNKEAEQKIKLLKLQIDSLKKEYQNNEINNNNNNNNSFNINNFINLNSKPPYINYRNNVLSYGSKKEYLTSLTNEQNKIRTMDSSPKKAKITGRTIPFSLKKISKNINDIPIGNKNKKMKKKESDIPFRHIPNPLSNKSLSVKKEKENYLYNNNNGSRLNQLTKDNMYYNKSFKDLNNINNENLINNIEEKNKSGDGVEIIENGMSQSEINSNIEVDNKKKNKNKKIKSTNNLFNSQIERKDKESVDNLKIFLNKLIDDLDI